MESNLYADNDDMTVNNLDGSNGTPDPGNEPPFSAMQYTEHYERHHNSCLFTATSLQAIFETTAMCVLGLYEISLRGPG